MRAPSKEAMQSSVRGRWYESLTVIVFTLSYSEQKRRSTSSFLSELDGGRPLGV